MVITAVSLNMFLIPNKVATGGISGLATVLHYLLDWPVPYTPKQFIDYLFGNLAFPAILYAFDKQNVYKRNICS